MPMSKVLVVDDNDDVREGARRLLEQEGFHTVGASNGAEAIQVLKEPGEPPCMILMDLMMPVMSGWQLLSVLSVDERWSKIPRVVMTAAGGDLHVDPTPVLRKPFDCDRLISAVREACGPR
jgi:CheY-like chemotaxis protein